MTPARMPRVDPRECVTLNCTPVEARAILEAIATLDAYSAIGGKS